MRIRFKLRTLLIATAIIAAVFGFMINQVMNVSRERSALEKLESEWDLRIDNDNPFLMVEQGWIEQSSDWAVQKLSGIKPRRRCRQLELTSKTMDSITLMGQLRKLKHVKRLSLRFRRQGYFSSLTAPSIESNEYRHIRKMRGLQELMIDYPISDSVVQELKSMKLTKLELKAEKWTQASFDAIGDMRTLRSLHLKADRFSTENLNAIGKLNSLEALTLWTNDGYVIKRSPGKPSFRKFESPLNFESICDLPNLTWLNINGHVDKAQFDTLSRLTNLTTLGLEYSNVDDSFLDCLMRLKTRPQLHFGKLQITWATFDTLRDAGFDVMHDGLIQELEENYLRYGSVNYRLHSVGKSLSASIGLLDDSVTWRFTAKVSLKDNWQWNSHPTFWSPPFQFPGDWRDLVGKTAEINYRFGQQPEGGLNFGQRVSPEKNRFRFVSRTGNQIRLRGDFHANPPGQGAGKIDVVLPFEFVYVETGLNYLPEDAKELLGQHFDIEDFDEPVEVEVNYWFNSQSAAKFRLKKSLRTEADHN